MLSPMVSPGSAWLLQGALKLVVGWYACGTQHACQSWLSMASHCYSECKDALPSRESKRTLKALSRYLWLLLTCFQLVGHVSLHSTLHTAALLRRLDCQEI